MRKENVPFFEQTSFVRDRLSVEVLKIELEQLWFFSTHSHPRLFSFLGQENLVLKQHNENIQFMETKLYSLPHVIVNGSPDMNSLQFVSHSYKILLVLNTENFVMRCYL